MPRGSGCTPKRWRAGSAGRTPRSRSLRLGAALHDVGKVNVRPDVLSKPGRLDDAELAEVRAHPVEGAWLIAGIPSLAAALPYVLFHHERWDGLATRRAAPGSRSRSRAGCSPSPTRSTR